MRGDLYIVLGFPTSTASIAGPRSIVVLEMFRAITRTVLFDYPWWSGGKRSAMACCRNGATSSVMGSWWSSRPF